jgi:O-antigen ligase
MTTKSWWLAISEPAPGGVTPLLLGLFAAALGALLLLVPPGFALVCGIAILMLSAAENEAFLLLVIFLTPVGWIVGKTESIVSAFPSRSNIDAALLLRCLVVAGFFAGRFARGEIEIRKLLRPALAKASVAFMAAIAISALLSEPDERLASLIRVAVRMIAYLGFFLFIMAWCNSRERVQRVAQILLISTLVTAAFALIQSAAGGYTFLWHFLYPEGSDTFPWDSRATSFFDYPNDLASYLNLILPFALACAAVRGSKWKSLGACTLVMGTAALFCTQSRGGMLGFGCMLLAATHFLVEKRQARVLLVCATATLALSFYLGVAATGAEHLGGSDLSSGATRLYLWAAALQLFLGSPLHGVGWGNFQVLYRAYLDESMVGESQLGVHSTYLSLLAETGVLGFLSFLTLLVVGFREACRRLRGSADPFARSLGFAVAGAIAALVVQGFVEFQIAFTQFGVLFWTLLALLVASAPWQSDRVSGARKLSPAEA